MNPVDLNLRSFLSPISGTYHWMGRHLQILRPFITWRTVIGGMGLGVLAGIIGRLVYQRLHSPAIKPMENLKNDREIVACAELEPREESLQVVGNDTEFNFGKHLKTLDGQPITPKPDDYYVFFRISDSEIQNKLIKIMREGKFFEFDFNRSQVSTIINDATIEDNLSRITYLYGIVLPSTLFHHVKEKVSFKWDDHTITLQLTPITTLRASHYPLFKGLIDLAAAKTEERDRQGNPVQFLFHEIFPFLEEMHKLAASRLIN